MMMRLTATTTNGTAMTSEFTGGLAAALPTLQRWLARPEIALVAVHPVHTVASVDWRVEQQAECTTVVMTARLP